MYLSHKPDGCMSWYFCKYILLGYRNNIVPELAIGFKQLGERGAITPGQSQLIFQEACKAYPCFLVKKHSKREYWVRFLKPKSSLWILS